MARVFIGLGSNLGDRRANLGNALAMIGSSDGIRMIKASSVKETDPVDYAAQPKFLNQVAMAGTGLDPRALLRVLKNIETALGRTATFPKGPRIIDLDILLYGDAVLDSGMLIIPHPRILERKFVVEHLVEIDPELRDPATGKKFMEALESWRE